MPYFENSAVEINKHQISVKKFGFALSFGCALNAYFLRLRHVQVSYFLVAIAIFFFIATIFKFALMSQVKKHWLKIISQINLIVLQLMLTIIYIFILIPTKILIYSTNKNKMNNSGFEINAKTMWKKSENIIDFRNQF